MFKKWLLILLSMLIALQSLGAIVDEFQSHQTSQNLFTFDDGRDSLQTKNLQILDGFRESASIEDSHHCCYCHGSVVLTNAENMGLAKLAIGSKCFQALMNFSSIYLLPKLRPPIA